MKIDPVAVDVGLTAETLRVLLADGRATVVPLAWFPRLQNASAPARANWQLLGGGTSIHWPDIDEDLSVAGLLATR